MPLRSLIPWLFGLWLAAGVEAAVGGGFPGPILLVALAAAFSSNPVVGMIIGLCAGLCSATLTGTHLLTYTLISVAAGMGAGSLARWISPRNILVASCVAALFSFIICVILSLDSGIPFGRTLVAALVRGLANSLWMLLIYGIVLLLSARRSKYERTWNTDI